MWKEGGTLSDFFLMALKTRNLIVSRTTFRNVRSLQEHVSLTEQYYVGYEYAKLKLIQNRIFPEKLSLVDYSEVFDD